MRQGPSWTTAVVCLLIAGCGAADERVDPGDLALRDLLGVQPKVVASWDEAQRAAAREVLAGGLAAREPVALTAPLADDEAALVRALAASDAVLDDAGDDARGLVVVTAARRELAVLDSPTATALLVAEPADPAVSLDLDPRAWTCPAQPCDLGVLAALAVDAAPGAPLVRVRPVVQLATIAALTTGADGVPILLVNPVVTAVGIEAPAEIGGATTTGAAARGAPALPPPPLTRGVWTYGGTRGACASQVDADCATCLGGGLCEPVWGSVSGMEACTMLEANASRNYDLVCINLAVSLADIRACVQGRAPSCAIDDNAIDLPAELANNANFLDDATCGAALEACLDQLYGTGGGGSDGCSACDGCDCGGCNDNSGDNGCSLNDQNMDNNCNGCNGGGCNDSGGGCNGGGGNGSCSVAGAGRRGPGLGVALVWVLLPVPVALRARRRARRLVSSEPAVEPPSEPPAAT